MTDWTERVNDNSSYWMSITSNSDGMKLAVIESIGGNIWVSNDAGITWDKRTFGWKNWNKITSSSDGMKLAATVYDGNIWTSGDAGITWNERTVEGGKKNWVSITSSSDGEKLAATVQNGKIWTSSDAGINWDHPLKSTIKDWTSITSSSNGMKLAATVNGGKIWISSDTGITWTGKNIKYIAWTSITSSSDGKKLAVVPQDGNIWISHNTGKDWKEKTVGGGTQIWTSITSSSNGMKLAATVDKGNIWTSDDAGETWAEVFLGNDLAWRSITSNSDGTKLAVTTTNGDIWTYSSPNDNSVTKNYMNCETCMLTPNFNYIHNLNTTTDIKKSNIDTNLKALMFMIIKEKYYKKLIENVDKAATYQKENKRFYMSFYDFDTHTNHKMDSRDVYLAKNQIFTNTAYKQYIRYKLFKDGYTNITSYVDAGNCSSNKNNLLKFNRYEYNKEGLVYNKNHLSCTNDCTKQLENLGYCSVAEKRFK